MKVISFSLAVVLSCFVSISAFASKVKNTTTGAEYDTLNEAVKTASGECTLELLGDIEITEQIKLTATKTITIDAKGHNVTTTLKKLGASAPEESSYFSPSVFFVSTKNSYRPCIIFKDTGNSNGVKGAYNGLSFVALSESSLSELYVQIKIESGNFDDCSIYSVDYKSKVVIEGGNFTGGNIITRSLLNSSTCMADIEINGGEYDSVNFILRPRYGAAKDTMHINAGEFVDCDIRSHNGRSALLTIGGSVETSNLEFSNCDINSYIGSSSYTPELTIKRGNFSECNLGANNNSSKDGVYVNGTATMNIEGGSYTDCILKAQVYGASTVTAQTETTINIREGIFTGGKIIGICGDGGSFDVKPQVNITDGDFNGVAVQIRSCYKKTAQGKLTIENGVFKYCAIIANGFIPECIINGGIFKGCLIGAHMQQRYYEGNAKVTVNSMIANGCQFFADTLTSSSSTGSNAPHAQANVNIKSGSFINCTQDINKSTTYYKAYINIATGVSLNGSAIANVGETSYSKFSDVIALLDSNNNLEINLANDIFTPVSSSFSGGIWATPTRSTAEIEIGNGKRVIINASGKEIDSNFNVLGSLILAGGYYTGSLETPSVEVEGGTASPSGIVYAKVGTKFPENPLEDDSLRFKLMGSVAVEENGAGDYEVVYVPGFSVRIR
jgi:hypothetical protein